MIRYATALVAVVGLTVLAGTAQAGKFNKKLNIGDKAPAWKDLEGTDGKKHALADLAGRDAVVVVFTCNTCPVATDYEDRIIAFANEYAKPGSKVAVVAINVNTVKGDQLPDMRKRAEKKKFPFPYLYDESQKIARDYGARFTPEFFVLDRDRKVVFQKDKVPAPEVKADFVVGALNPERSIRRAAISDRYSAAASARSCGTSAGGTPSACSIWLTAAIGCTDRIRAYPCRLTNS